MQRRGPFFLNVFGSQVHEFEQGHIAGKSSLGLGYLPNLPVIALHGIGGINELAYGSGVLEIGCQLLPVISPRGNNDRTYSLSSAGNPSFQGFHQIIT